MTARVLPSGEYTEETTTTGRGLPSGDYVVEEPSAATVCIAALAGSVANVVIQSGARTA